MQSLARPASDAAASEQEYTKWANKYLDEFNEAHEPHATKEVNGVIIKGTYTDGCAKCVVKAVRFMGRSEEARAFVESLKARYGVANLNRIIQTFALALGDSEFVKELT